MFKNCLHWQRFIPYRPYRLSESIDVKMEELYKETLGGGHANMEQLVRGTLSCGTQRGDDRVDAANISTYLHNIYISTLYLHIYVSAGVVAGPRHVPAPAEEAAGLHVSLCGGGGGAALLPGQGARHTHPGTVSIP